tara:strand:+ start:1202 stop:1552 length:351 start_codon:yes stop_codon:yes gene_type:complete
MSLAQMDNRGRKKKGGLPNPFRRKKQEKGVASDSSENESRNNEHEGKTEKQAQRLLAIYDYDGEEGELSFKEHDELSLITMDESGWWVAKNQLGEVGLIPENYVKKLSEVCYTICL